MSLDTNAVFEMILIAGTAVGVFCIIVVGVYLRFNLNTVKKTKKIIAEQKALRNQQALMAS